MLRPVVCSVVTNIHWSRILPPFVTLTNLCGVLTVINSTHPAKQHVYQVFSKFNPKHSLLKALCNSDRHIKKNSPKHRFTREESRNVVTYYAYKHQQAQGGAHPHRMLYSSRVFLRTELSAV